MEAPEEAVSLRLSSRDGDSSDGDKPKKKGKPGRWFSLVCGGLWCLPILVLGLLGPVSWLLTIYFSIDIALAPSLVEQPLESASLGCNTLAQEAQRLGVTNLLWQGSCNNFDGIRDILDKSAYVDLITLLTMLIARQQDVKNWIASTFAQDTGCYDLTSKSMYYILSVVIFLLAIFVPRSFGSNSHSGKEAKMYRPIKEIATRFAFDRRLNNTNKDPEMRKDPNSWKAIFKRAKFWDSANRPENFAVLDSWDDKWRYIRDKMKPARSLALGGQKFASSDLQALLELTKNEDTETKPAAGDSSRHSDSDSPKRNLELSLIPEAEKRVREAEDLMSEKMANVEGAFNAHKMSLSHSFGRAVSQSRADSELAAVIEEARDAARALAEAEDHLNQLRANQRENANCTKRNGGGGTHDDRSMIVMEAMIEKASDNDHQWTFYRWISGTTDGDGRADGKEADEDQKILRKSAESTSNAFDICPHKLSNASANASPCAQSNFCADAAAYGLSIYEPCKSGSGDAGTPYLPKPAMATFRTNRFQLDKSATNIGVRSMDVLCVSFVAEKSLFVPIHRDSYHDELKDGDIESRGDHVTVDAEGFVDLTQFSGRCPVCTDPCRECSYGKKRVRTSCTDHFCVDVHKNPKVLLGGEWRCERCDDPCLRWNPKIRDADRFDTDRCKNCEGFCHHVKDPRTCKFCWCFSHNKARLIEKTDEDLIDGHYRPCPNCKPCEHAVYCREACDECFCQKHEIYKIARYSTQPCLTKPDASQKRFCPSCGEIPGPLTRKRFCKFTAKLFNCRQMDEGSTKRYTWIDILDHVTADRQSPSTSIWTQGGVRNDQNFEEIFEAIRAAQLEIGSFVDNPPGVQTSRMWLVYNPGSPDMRLDQGEARRSQQQEEGAGDEATRKLEIQELFHICGSQWVKNGEDLIRHDPAADILFASDYREIASYGSAESKEPRFDYRTVFSSEVLRKRLSEMEFERLQETIDSGPHAFFEKSNVKIQEEKDGNDAEGREDLYSRLIERRNEETRD
ncbi:Hypothetical Protein FCC1311_099062 [Hondaea fermentalgiana]|uniref:Uncharacterized protein n=1 Tax=Hondaea fermentalgiana TaxID=2315210 RepID=A0A2R5GY85_9STRA|nr:Hypothetical Protein FCC1311_099062 [Hondaea fermentalgiana]|eukprot:GBG33683.1 Hypothetical Protein FCC1311_099062 [Hondaea fermentalgiana]